jgi:hypothetical protein
MLQRVTESLSLPPLCRKRKFQRLHLLQIRTVPGMTLPYKFFAYCTKVRGAIKVKEVALFRNSSKLRLWVTQTLGRPV